MPCFPQAVYNIAGNFIHLKMSLRGSFQNRGIRSYIPSSRLFLSCSLLGQNCNRRSPVTTEIRYCGIDRNSSCPLRTLDLYSRRVKREALTGGPNTPLRSVLHHQCRPNSPTSGACTIIVPHSWKMSSFSLPKLLKISPLNKQAFGNKMAPPKRGHCRGLVVCEKKIVEFHEPHRAMFS